MTPWTTTHADAAVTDTTAPGTTTVLDGPDASNVSPEANMQAQSAGQTIPRPVAYVLMNGRPVSVDGLVRGLVANVVSDRLGFLSGTSVPNLPIPRRPLRIDVPSPAEPRPEQEPPRKRQKPGK